MDFPEFYDHSIDERQQEKIKSGSGPELEGYTPEAKREKTERMVRELFNNLPEDQQELTPKIRASLMLADSLNMKPSTAYRNFETVAKQYWQTTSSPQGVIGAFERAWDIGWKEYELGKLSYRKMMGEDVDEQIKELKEAMPPPDEKERALPVSMVKSGLSFAPIMIGGMTRGAQEGLALGAGGASAAAVGGLPMVAGPQATLGGAPAYATSITGAFAMMFSIGARKGTMEDIGQVEAGLSYDEMIGEGIPNRIAMSASAGVGIVNTALETMQISKIPGVDALIDTALRRGVRNVMKSGAIRGAAAEFAKKYSKNIPEQVLQELAQETTNVLATETAKEFANLSEKKNIDKATGEEIAKRMKETAIESAKAFTVMGLPGAVGSSVHAAKSSKQLQSATDNVQQIDIEEEIWNKLAEAEGGELDDLVAAINEQTGQQERTESTVELTTEGVKVVENGKAKKVEFEVDDDAVNISSFSDMEPVTARNALAKIQTEYPDRVLQFSEAIENAPKVKRAIEDLDPNARILNFELDRFDERISSLESDLETQQSEIAAKRDEVNRLKKDSNTEEEVAAAEQEIETLSEQVKEIQATIELTQEQRQEIEQAKEKYNPLEYRKPWKMTSGEFRRHLQGRAEMQEDAASSAQGMSLKSELVQNFNVREDEAEAGVRLVEAIAASNGEDVQGYMDRTFRFATEEETAQIEGKAKDRGVAWSGAHEIADDGRSIIAASETADFSTFMHEMGHVLRRDLSVEQENIVAEWAGAVRDEEGNWNWNETAEENFADGFVEYMRSGNAPDSTLQEIFEKIANALREIVNRVFRQVGVTGEVESVFDEFFEGWRGERSAQESGTLFQGQGKLELDMEYIQETAEGKDLSTPEDVALHNTKVEIKEILYGEQALSDDAIDEINDTDEISDLEGSVTAELLEYVGENRDVDDIYKEQLEIAEEDSSEIEEFTPEGDIIEWAKQAKGITDDINEAGYVLPDGQMLDFSGKREGGGPGARVEDHRRLGIPLKGELSGSELMSAFQAEGAIRVDANSGLVGIGTEPTQDQLRIIRDIIETNDLVMVDLFDGNRHAYFESEASYNKTIGQIRRFYNGGEITEELLFQPAPPVESEEFQNWFKDSEVVNEDGRPQVVFHGSAGYLRDQQFKKEMLGSQTGASSAHKGFFFSNKGDIAASYADQTGYYDPIQKRKADETEQIYDLLREEEHKLQREGADIDTLTKVALQTESAFNEMMQEQNKLTAHPNITPVYLSIQNPLVYDYEGEVWHSRNKKRITELIEEAKENGNDGVIIKDIYDSTYSMLGEEGIGTDYIVFEPEQIKSVYNKGTFDPDNPNILFQKSSPEQVQQIKTDIQAELDKEITYDEDLLELHKRDEETIEETRQRLEDQREEEKTALKNLSPYGTIFRHPTGNNKVFHVSSIPEEVFRLTSLEDNSPVMHIPLVGTKGLYGIIDEVESIVSEGYEFAGSYGVPFTSIDPQGDHGQVIDNQRTLYQTGPLYHGSPYEIDRFSTEKIGTGEGAQAFGWGLYFTGSEQIGRFYANALSTVTYNGIELNLSQFGQGEIKRRLQEEAGLDYADADTIYNYIFDFNLDIEKFREEKRDNIRILKERGEDQSVIDMVEKEIEHEISVAEDAAEQIQPSRHLYTVTLHKGKDPSEYSWIDWYKEVSKEKIDQINNALDYYVQDRVEQDIEERRRFLEDNGYLVIEDQLNKEREYLTKKYKVTGGTGSDVYWSLTLALGSKREASLFLSQAAGIDGIRYSAGTLSGVESETNNYVVFDENAVTIEDRVLFQRSPEHEQEVKTAVDQGFPVPQHVLNEYSDKEWAQQEMKRRQQILQKLEDFAWLATEARNFDDEKEFAEYAKSEMFQFIAEEEDPTFFEDGGPSDQWLQQFWRDAHEEEFFVSASLEEGNKRWLEQVNRTYIEQVVDHLAQKYVGQKGKSIGVHGYFLATAAKWKANKRIPEDKWQQLEDIVRKNPTKYREILSHVLEDDAELQRYRIEEAADEAKGITPSDVTVEPRSRLKLANQLKKLKAEQVQNGSITQGEIERIHEETETQLRKSEAQVQKLTKELRKEQQEAHKRAVGASKSLQKKQDQIKELEKEVRQRDRDLKKMSAKNEKAKERLRKVREEKNEKLKALRKEYQAKIREIKKEATKKKNEAIKKERERQKEIQAKKREAQKLRDYKKKLARAITRPVPKSVHWEYREQVEALQAQIDPNFRSRRTHEVWTKRKDFFERNPDVLNEISPDLAKKLQQQSLDQISLEELEDLYEQVEQLIQVGKTRLRLQEQRKKAEAKDAATRIAQSLLKGEKVEQKEPILDSRQTVGEKAQGLYYSTIRPSRLADMLDGGADFKGFAHKVFIDEVNEAYRDALQQRFNREAVISEKMKEVGLTMRDIAATRTIDGVDFTVDQILDIYAGSKNELKWRAIVHGNNIDPRVALNAIASMSEAERQFADAIMGDYEENYHRLRKAHLDLTNEDMGKEANYTPMRRTERDYTSHKEEISREILLKKSLRQGTAWRGMTKSRIQISDKHQRPIRLGLYSTWVEQVNKQEHYIASADQLQKLNRIMRDDYFQDAVEQQIGKPMLDKLQNYINRFANPSVYKSHSAVNKWIKKLRNNVALAYLAFNLVTMVKQIPSLAFYMQSASPADLLAGLFKAGSDWKRTREFIEARDPQMRERAIERDLEELKNLPSSGYQKIQKKISDTGMKGILFFDKITTTAGWIAVYDKYRRQGYSEEEAVKAARDTTLRTQPQASAKDIADLYAEDNLLTLFTQFSNQLNQIWNMTTYDMPAAIRQGQYWKSMGIFTSMALSGLVIWMLSERRPPEDPEDWAKVMTEQFLNMIPVAGPVIARTMDGWSTDVSVFTPAVGVGKLAGLLEDMAKGQDISDSRYEYVMKSCLEGLAIATGLPYVTPRRMVEGWQEDALVQTVLFGGKVGEAKDED